MKKITRDDIHLTIRCEEDPTPPEGNASALDAETDAQVLEWIGKELESGNQWAWCIVTVRGEYKGIYAEDSLCCCSYRSEDDFKSGGYYDDMARNVVDDLNDTVSTLCSSLQD